MGRYRLSKRQVAHLVAECFGITLAASTVVNQQQVISQALAIPVAELAPVVQNEPVGTIDETSWRQVGSAKRPWLWTGVTAHFTLFRIAPSRSSQIAKDLLDETYGGVAGTDRCNSYTGLDRRQLCGRHLVRDFQKILERGGDSHRIGWYLKCQAEYLLMGWARGREGTLDYFTFLAEFPAIQTHIRCWLTTGLTATSSRTAETCLAGWRLSLTGGALPLSQVLSPPITAPNARYATPFSGDASPMGPSPIGVTALWNGSSPWLKRVANNNGLSLTSYGMPSWLIALDNLLLRSYPLTNLKPFLDFPPERIRRIL
jgi:hypothetical protein